MTAFIQKRGLICVLCAVYVYFLCNCGSSLIKQLFGSCLRSLFKVCREHWLDIGTMSNQCCKPIYFQAFYHHPKTEKYTMSRIVHYIMYSRK